MKNPTRFEGVQWLVQWDNASRAWPFRVLTVSGRCVAYFRSRSDAIAYCEEVQP